jgi:hypothetical protein
MTSGKRLSSLYSASRKCRCRRAVVAGISMGRRSPLAFSPAGQTMRNPIAQVSDIRSKRDVGLRSDRKTLAKGREMDIFETFRP